MSINSYLYPKGRPIRSVEEENRRCIVQYFGQFLRTALKREMVPPVAVTSSDLNSVYEFEGVSMQQIVQWSTQLGEPLFPEPELERKSK